MVYPERKADETALSEVIETWQIYNTWSNKFVYAIMTLSDVSRLQI